MSLEVCLRMDVGRADPLESGGVVLELSDGDLAADRRTLYEAGSRAVATLEYAHFRAPQEPLLWIADACAWAWSHGGMWRAAVSPLITKVHEVQP